MWKPEVSPEEAPLRMEAVLASVAWVDAKGNYKIKMFTDADVDYEKKAREFFKKFKEGSGARLLVRNPDESIKYIIDK